MQMKVPSNFDGCTIFKGGRKILTNWYKIHWTNLACIWFSCDKIHFEWIDFVKLVPAKSELNININSAQKITIRMTKIKSSISQIKKLKTKLGKTTTWYIVSIAPNFIVITKTYFSGYQNIILPVISVY